MASKRRGSGKHVRNGRKQKSGSYEVGYGRPPKDSQFKPGISPNPSGRRKGSRNRRSIVSDVIDEKLPLIIKGKKTYKSKYELMHIQQCNKALAGDTRAFVAVMARIDKFELEAAQSSGGTDLGLEARSAMQALVRRIREAAVLVEDDDAPPTDESQSDVNDLANSKEPK